MPSLRQPLGMLVGALAFALFLGSGFTAVPPNAVGYGRLLGKVYWRDLQPGLHYLAPWPFVAVDKWPVREVKSIMGYPPNPVEYVSGDLNLLSITLDVQYRVKDPYVYHYRTSKADEAIRGIVTDHVRTFVSARAMEQLLNVHRTALEEHVRHLFEVSDHGQTPVLDSVELIKANLLTISPVSEALSAFREVSAAQEDRERIVVNAHRFLVSLSPQAHGNANYEREQADGEAYRKVVVAAAEADAISLVATAVRRAPGVLRNMLWREKLETALSGNSKIIVPNRQMLDKIALWKRNPAERGAETHHSGRDR